MTCVVVNFNPHFAKHGDGDLPSSLTYAQVKASSPKLAEALFIPPSALYSQSPLSPIDSDPEELLEFQEDEASEAALLAAMPPVEEEYVDLEGPCENSRRLSPGAPAAAHTRRRTRRAPRHNTIAEWAKKFGEQPVEPPWWETELASSIHQTLRERETAIGDIQFKSPQLEQRLASTLIVLLVPLFRPSKQN